MLVCSPTASWPGCTARAATSSRSLTIDDEVRRGDVVLRDIAGASPSEIVHDRKGRARTPPAATAATPRRREATCPLPNAAPDSPRSPLHGASDAKDADTPGRRRRSTSRSTSSRRSAPTTGCAIRATATPRTPRSSRRASPRSRARRPRSSSAAAWAPPRARCSPCSAPAITSSPARGSTAARTALHARSSRRSASTSRSSIRSRRAAGASGSRSTRARSSSRRR